MEIGCGDRCGEGGVGREVWEVMCGGKECGDRCVEAGVGEGARGGVEGEKV